MSSFTRRLQSVPAYPLFPFVPLVVAAAVLTLSALSFSRLVKISRLVETALRTQRGGATA